MSEINERTMVEQMNALELAKLLETDCWYRLITREGIAIMLRQQQAEIDELKATIGKITISSNMTDEEIDNVGDEVSNLIDTYAGRREFAREILRKAQEK